jgi:hypothetical protein
MLYSDSTIFKAILGFISIFTLCGCTKDNTVNTPVVKSLTLYHPDVNRKDSLVTVVTANRPLTIKVETDGELCTVWPAGDRVVRKSVTDPSKDSVDKFNNVVLVRSDDYRDYKLVGARGAIMSGTQFTGYSLVYTLYKTPGSYILNVVSTKHGYDSPGAVKTVYQQSITVK